MKIHNYLNFENKTEEAFRFYEQHLGGRITGISRHADAPNPSLPADWKSRVLHARIELGGTVLMGADIPGAEPMRPSAQASRAGDSASLMPRITTTLILMELGSLAVSSVYVVGRVSGLVIGVSVGATA